MAGEILYYSILFRPFMTRIRIAEFAGDSSELQSVLPVGCLPDSVKNFTDTIFGFDKRDITI